MRLSSGKLPKRARVRPLISEFGKLVQVSSSLAPLVDANNVVVTEFDEDVPAGARLLNGGALSSPAEGNKCWRFGVYREPLNFFLTAISKPHPVELNSGLPVVVLRALAKYLWSTPAEIVASRSASIQQLIAWKKDPGMPSVTPDTRISDILAAKDLT
eukprot:6486150-Amphidinium_carterae.1